MWSRGSGTLHHSLCRALLLCPKTAGCQQLHPLGSWVLWTLGLAAPLSARQGTGWAAPPPAWPTGASTPASPACLQRRQLPKLQHAHPGGSAGPRAPSPSHPETPQRGHVLASAGTDCCSAPLQRSQLIRWRICHAAWSPVHGQSPAAAGSPHPEQPHSPAGSTPPHPAAGPGSGGDGAESAEESPCPPTRPQPWPLQLPGRSTPRLGLPRCHRGPPGP